MSVCMKEVERSRLKEDAAASESALLRSSVLYGVTRKSARHRFDAVTSIPWSYLDLKFYQAPRTLSLFFS